MSSSLIGYPTNLALCQIEVKSFVNYYCWSARLCFFLIWKPDAPRVQGQHIMVRISFYDLSLFSCRQGLKVERNKLFRTACICIIFAVIDIIIAIQHYTRCYFDSPALNGYCMSSRRPIKSDVRKWWQGRCPWCSRYRRRKWTRRHEFKSWTRLITFHIALIPLGKV